MIRVGVGTGFGVSVGTGVAVGMGVSVTGRAVGGMGVTVGAGVGIKRAHAIVKAPVISMMNKIFLFMFYSPHKQA